MNRNGNRRTFMMLRGDGEADTKRPKIGAPLQRAPKPMAAHFYRPSRVAGTRTEGQETKCCGRTEGVLDTGYAKGSNKVSREHKGWRPQD